MNRPPPEAARDPERVADDSEPGETNECREGRVDASGHGQRLDKLLVRIAPEFSRSHLQGLIERGHVRLDGATCTKAAAKLRAGQAIAVELVPTDESRAYVAQPMALELLHEDEQLLVVNKPVGLVVHPAPGHWSGTLLNGLLAHHAEAAWLPRGGIVHRLDKDTSGAMVVAKTLPAMTALVRDIAARKVSRQYLAIAHGRVGDPATSIQAPIGRDPISRVKMAVVATAAGGKPSRTDVERVGGDGRLSALQCRLHSGRTHQIRVHLAQAGHPLVGDTLYGGEPALGLARQALHAFRLGFEHPVTHEALCFVAPPPQDFADAWLELTGSAAEWCDRTTPET